MKKRTIIAISSLILLGIVIVYVIIQVFTPGTVLYVEPKTSSKPIDQDFAVNITIANVADLFAWQFKLTWNATMLDLLNVTEGSFLKSGGSNTYFYYNFTATAGNLTADCVLLGDVPGVSGNGVLATVHFHVKGSGSCDLDLSKITLYNSAEKQITNSIVDGQFHT